ncbi:hypothetical protein O3G_MSEX009951 [Manduca sexta]|uniref:DM13 domain-containing protein n=1 Tax=Manduca sexta TaxID=7130 RepID=A0A921ZFH7_MANSE|nr:hypothetical protein O3G_MSEX009951 [Manduca sexta]KAG6456794.1 hypothetical protein O3G_MSEX009951 [Manduca sexta]
MLCVVPGLSCWCGAQTRYQGREIGALSQLQHGVRGRVFAVDSRTIHLADLHYDGEGPAAYFYVGKSKAPTAEGAHRLRDERGGAGPLRRYRGESITLALPDGLSLKDLRWFAIYCDEYAVNFGDVRIPRDLEYPKPAKVGALRGVHGVWSEPVVVVDAQTLLVPHFSYDGEAPDAKFWVGRGESPSPQGIRIPDENGKETPLRKYDKKTIVLTLPGELTVFDIGHFGVWCEAFTVDFGHVPLPRAALRNVPPSLKMLGVSPQSRNTALAGATEAPTPPSRRPRPHARLDATTYRPHLRPGTGPLQALADQSSDHSALHRRADTYTPPPQQLLTVQGDTKDDQEDSSEQNDEQGELAEEKDEQVKQQATEPTPSHETQHLPLSLSDSQTVVTSEYYTQQQAHQKASQQAPQQNSLHIPTFH